MGGEVKPGMDRRDFMATTLGTAGFMIINSGLIRGSSANSAIRLGLLGCGRRGSANASEMIKTGCARVVALADLFEDQLDKAKEHFDTLSASTGLSILDRSLMFAGPYAFEKICRSKEIDAILIGSPPYFHAEHLKASVEAGKHVYCETPVAVDVRGAAEVIEIGKKAEGKLTIDTGFQFRSAPSFVELMKRLHTGELGTIGCGDIFYRSAIEQAADFALRPQMFRLRNWSRDSGLSGGNFVEQNIHMIDICNWALQARPSKALGRIVRTRSGDTTDSYNVVFYYPKAVHVAVKPAQFAGRWQDVNARFFGTRGIFESHYSGTCAIYGQAAWASEGPDREIGAGSKPPVPASKDDLAMTELIGKRAFVDSIIRSQFYNQIPAAVETALTAVLGRNAARIESEVGWDELLSSEEKLDPRIDLAKLSRA
jgi:predicted dehydrogenase